MANMPGSSKLLAVMFSHSWRFIISQAGTFPTGVLCQLTQFGQSKWLVIGQE
ncbi:hypothetical protein DY000_02042624 [Brassica cretica]|uniref:Uncharacterized protein n=1 Tax=Brassica cretica TaxID=69181 RepID=A0ABQ7BD64_BRACR|nr:hypothetical protein DY000_02042624 [Brassica cretica]